MARLLLMNLTGGTVLEWNARPGPKSVQEIAALKAAEQAFRAGLQQGGAAFDCRPGRAPERLERFEAGAEEIVMIPRLAGGAVSPDDRTLMTAAGMARLEEELIRLRTVQRAEVAARLQSARETPGDQSDNLELLEAQHELGMLEARIADLEHALAQAQVVEAAHGDSVAIGSIVLVRDEDGEEESYTLVGPAEGDPRQGLISIASPVGRALLGARAGDRAVVATPAGERLLQVLKVA
jgi:transcription elongation factor GreA